MQRQIHWGGRGSSLPKAIKLENILDFKLNYRSRSKNAVKGSHTHPEEFLDNFWQQELSTRGETVTYKFKKDNYYVISGINPNGYEFYHKVFFYPTYWLEFEMTYPHAQHATYDRWVERIAHDFVPVLPR
jgi:hypothetical protein